MKEIIFFSIIIFTISVQAQNQDGQKTIDTLIKSVCSDKMILQSVTEIAKGAKLTHESFKEFYISIASIPADMDFQEKILSYAIQIAGTMA